MEERKFLPLAKAGYAALSCILCGMGFWTALQPTFPAAFLGIAAGCMMMAFGAVKMLGYFSRDLYQLAFQHDLAFGMLLLALGALTLALLRRDLTVLCLVIGIAILADGLFKIQTAMDARRFGLPAWGILFALAALAGGFGALLAFRFSADAQTLTVLMGTALMLEGMLGLCVALCTLKVTRPPRARRDENKQAR